MTEFEEWLERVTAREAELGTVPWTDDIEERRQLWERRYTRPAPPQGLFTELADIRGTAR